VEELHVDISLVKRQRCTIEFCVRLGKSGSETLQLIHQAYGDDAMRRASVFKWWKRFRDGETNVKAEPRRSKPPVPLSWSLRRQTVCGTFSRSGWIVVRSASLAKGGTSKKRLSPHLHKFPNWSNKLSPRTFQTTFVYTHIYMHLNNHIIGQQKKIHNDTMTSFSVNLLKMFANPQTIQELQK
jgi:hypothetical protein